jgi:LacI family transcriptional regulator
MPRIPKVVLLLESSRASGRNLLRGVAEFARHHGTWSFYWEPRGLEAVWPQFKSLDADGVILRDVEEVKQIVKTGVPAVVVGHSKHDIPGLANVITDDTAIGQLAAEHLRDCGLREFAFCGFDEKPWSQRRAKSFFHHAAGCGGQTHLYRHPQSPARVSWQAERSYIADWLKSLPKPVGVMGCNDDRAQHVIEACKLAALRVPDEVAVIGADNDELVCGLANPPMSSVEINFERAGYESARVLDRLMRGGAPASLTIPALATHVVARASTDVIYLDDLQVVRALRFIRTHSQESIRVNDVAGAAGLSRRVLEKRFRFLMGRSVLSEIRRLRVEQICRLLLETNQPVSQIAVALSYENAQHISRYFHREKGATPLEYRKIFSRH